MKGNKRRKCIKGNTAIHLILVNNGRHLESTNILVKAALWKMKKGADNFSLSLSLFLSLQSLGYDIPDGEGVQTYFLD